MKKKTAVVAKSILSGHKALYVQRARYTLPTLVRLARSRRVITYGNLAKAMGIPRARNMNYVLGSIGTTLTEVSAQLGERIPPLQSIVVNSGTGLPGHGFDQFLLEWFDVGAVTKELRPVFLRGLHKKVFGYRGWGRVLKRLDLEIGDAAPIDDIDLGPVKRISGRGGGESPEHKALKLYLADRPRLFGLPERTTLAETEHVLPSGDKIDILFTTGRKRVAVEAKSLRSAEDDLLRGVFQCIKYEAVMRAESLWQSGAQTCSSMLALEGKATDSVRRVAGLLSVPLLEEVRKRC